jgi:hypothetical protein
MRVILAITAVVVVAALAWSGFWYWQVSLREQAIDGWLAERRADGWVAEAQGVEMAGFPSRVDTFITGLNLADPDAGWAWKADELQLLSLTYKPHHIIATLPGEQVFSTPYDTIRLHADALRGSVLFRPTPRLELDHMTFEIGDMQITGDAGWSAQIGKGLLATRQSAGKDVPPFAHDLAIQVSSLTLPPELMRTLRAGKVLPAEIGSMSLDAMLDFDQPWDRASVEAGLPTLEGVNVRDLHLSWGRLDLRGKGDLDVDAKGFAEGRLDFTATNWRDMIDVAEQSGVIGSTMADTLRVGLGLLSQMAGKPDAIEIPLEFSAGQTRLGPIPLGPAPRLATR